MPHLIRKGRHCSLGLIEGEHLSEICRFFNDPVVWAHTTAAGNRLPRIEENFKEWTKYGGWDVSFGIFASLVPKGAHERLVGFIRLFGTQAIDKFSESGFLIGYPELWGKGIGVEAQLLQLEYAFNHIGLRWVYASTFPLNERSTRALLRVGYKMMGTFPQKYWHAGTYHDEVAYGICEGWWRPVWDAYRTSM